VFEFYAEIRLVHMTAAFASGGLFLLRGLALPSGADWSRAAPLRFASYVIDTVLLTAALMLMTIVGQYPFVDGWLTMKVALLAVYVVLGMLAFWSGWPLAARIGCWLAGLAVYAFIVSVARAHHPLGVLSP